MIYVITHKKFDDSIVDKRFYNILHVGKNNEYKECYLCDGTGDNISNKNANYCELTGLYWIWKNGTEKDSDITGLVHYRRFFTSSLQEWKYTYFDIMPDIISYKVIEKTLMHHDIILPRSIKIRRTVRKFYNDFHVPEDMDIIRQIIAMICPEYIYDFDRVMNMHKFYYGNMLICKGNILREYSQWLFDILFYAEKKIDITKYKDDYQKRVFGFISERLLQVWVIHNKLRVKEFPVYNTEKRQPTLFATTKDRIKKFMN